MDYAGTRSLGKSGLKVGRLGVAGGYGAPASALEEAFERGVNYFYWGSIRRDNMAQAIRNLVKAGKRDELVVVVQVYNRIPWMIGPSVERALKRLKIDFADVLLLGWYNSPPKDRIMDAVRKLKERELVGSIAVSSHHRPAFPEIVKAEADTVDTIHIRYNATHRGAEEEVFPHLPEGKDRPGVVIYTATRWGQLPKKKYTKPGEETPRGSDCYRFVLTNPNVDVCICGPKNAKEMQEALAAIERGPMSEEELEWMRRVGDHLRSIKKFPFGL